MVIVLIAAVVVILALGGVNAAYQDPNPEDSTVTGFDDGSPDRADRLIGTIGPIVIDKKALSKLDGFFPWKDKFDPLIYYLVDNRYRLLDPVMVKSIMFTESGFNPNAERLEPQINDKSIGLMQIATNCRTSV
jgi:hypothetical protein